MTELVDFAGKELAWIRVKDKKNRYELRHDATVIGSLVWDKSGVEGELSGKRWSFNKEGFFRPRLLVREHGAPSPIAALEVGIMGSGQLSFSTGPSYRWTQRGLLSNSWAFDDDARQTVVSFKLSSGLLTTGATVTLGEKLAEHEHAPLLVLLGWYVLVLYAEDAAPTGV
jgi:hypothetical protein